MLFGPRALLQRVILETRVRYTKQETIQVTPQGATSPIYLRRATLDAYIYSEVFIRKDYMLSLPFTPKTILDCGGNIGLSAIYFALQYPDAKIVVFEPVADNYSILEKNTKCYPNIYHQQLGIWCRKARLKIENKPESRIRNMGQFFTREAGPDEAGDINAISVKDAMDQYGMDTIDLLKMDIEGGEKDVFGLGCKDSQVAEWLPRTKSIVIELHGGCEPEFNRIMSDYQFERVLFIKSPIESICVCLYMNKTLVMEPPNK
jgi:FkbM family methyltransferase